MNWPVLLLGL